MYRKFIALILVAVAGVMFGSACETIPDDDGGKVEISLSMLAPEKASGDMTALAVVGAYYHVKITLTNPNETFYAFNWTPPEPIILTLAASGERVINAEVYEVYPSASTNSFPASFYSSAWMPAHMRTVNLSGSDAQSITLFADFYPYLGDIGGGSQVLMSDGNTFIPLEFYRSCPPPDQFYANIVDLDWGGFNIFTPKNSIPLSLFGGSYPTLQMSNLPAGHNYQLEVFHATAGTWTRAKTYIDEGLNPVGLKLGGYADPWLTFDPETLTVPRDDFGEVYWELLGGWGSAGDRNTTPSDTCYGPWSWFDNPYYFTASTPPSCLIDVRVFDCRGAAATKSMTVTIPVCNNDGLCDDFAGETNGNCSADCYCGDGYCNPPEDLMNCSTDCVGPVYRP